MKCHCFWFGFNYWKIHWVSYQRSLVEILITYVKAIQPMIRLWSLKDTTISHPPHRCVNKWEVTNNNSSRTWLAWFSEIHFEARKIWSSLFAPSKYHIHMQSFWNYTLPETNIAPENGWLEYDRFLLGWPIFRCYVSFREGIYIYIYIFGCHVET